MSRRALAVLTAGFFTIFIAYAIRYGYGVLLPSMLPTLGITKTQAGAIYAAYFAAYTLCSPVIGLFSDRYDMRVLLTLFTGLLGGGAIFMAYADSVSKAAFFFTLAGVGHAACWAPVMALTQRWVAEQRRGTALGFVSLGGAVGMVVWSLFLPFIVGRYDWKAGWISLGGVCLLVAVLNFAAVRSHPEQSREEKIVPAAVNPLRTAIPVYRGLLRVKAFWYVGLAYLMVGFVTLVPYTFLSTFATEKMGLPYAAAARLITVIAAAGMAGKLLLATWSDSLGRVRVMMICAGLMAVGCTGMAVGGPVVMFYLYSALFGMGFGAVWPVYAAAAPDFFPASVAGSVIGLWTVLMGLGSIVSPLLCGWTIDRSGAYHPAFLLGTLTALASIGLLWPIRAAVRCPTPPNQT